MVHAIMSAGGKKKASRIKWRASKGGIKEREDTRPDKLLPRLPSKSNVTEGSGSGSNHLHDTVAQQAAPLPASEGV